MPSWHLVGACVGLTGLDPRYSVDNQVPIRGASRHGGDGAERLDAAMAVPVIAPIDCHYAKEPR